MYENEEKWLNRFFLLFLYDFKDPGHLVYSMVTQSVASLRVTTCTG